MKRIPLLPAAGTMQASEKFVEGSLGHLVVEISLRLDKKMGPKQSSKQKFFPSSVDVTSQVQSVSEYSTVFPCEAVTHSIMAQRVPSHVEQFHIATGHEGVVFFSDDYKSSSLADLKEKAGQALLHQFQRHYTKGGKDFIEYHVFENQRRVFLEWGGHHLMGFERPAYTEESGTTECPFTNHDVKFNPPQGYEWQHDSKDQWQVDKEYTNTDAEGWVYGSDFGYIMQNLRLGQSATSAQLRPTRRRRWIRVAVKTPIDTVAEVTAKIEETAPPSVVSSSAEVNEQISSKVVPAPHKKGGKSSAAHARTVEIFHVFHNQRRAVLTLSFGPGNLFHTDRQAFSDETGQRSYPHCKDVEDMVPPTGYEWLEGSKWKTDQEYTNCDEFGWAYGYVYFSSSIL